MDISSILAPSRCCARIEGGSKKRVLELTAKIIAQDYPTLPDSDLFSQLVGRERLGSTGIGLGVAIPHCRVDNCAGAIAALFTLEEPIDFEAVDDKPVDVVFALLVPAEAHEQHLQTLAILARTFSEPENLALLRNASDDQALYDAAVRLFAEH